MIRNTLNHCLKFALRSIFCHICYGKISGKNVNTFFKVKLFISKTSDSCFQGFDFFQMLLASHRYWKYQTSSLIFIKNKESLHGGLNTKNFCSLHIMHELPINKVNFLIKTTQDFNSSRHAAPHLPIVFTDNIILYFN